MQNTLGWGHVGVDERDPSFAKLLFMGSGCGCVCGGGGHMGAGGYGNIPVG